MENTELTQQPPESELIDIDYFKKVKLKAAKILTAQRVEGTDKLMKLSIDIGSQDRTLVAGIALHYSPEELVGKYIIVVSNLKPAKLKGITSQGMLLAAKDENGLAILTLEKPVLPGSPVS